MIAGLYLGIDFSGGAAAWRPRCSRPTVWIATVAGQGRGRPRLEALEPVQALPGRGAPFDRLVARLAAGDYVATGIDAPFCLPARYLPAAGHAALLAEVAALPGAADRLFPSGATLVDYAAARAPLDRKKPLRPTEQGWAARGVNTRSTLWNGPRGGAPFAAACLTLLARSGRPVWPWRSGAGLLVESFPAAQLKAWGLPHTRYAAPDQHAARALIVAGLARHIVLAEAQAVLMRACADALDAVLAAFGAIAAADGPPPAGAPGDGLISVMDGPAEDHPGPTAAS